MLLSDELGILQVENMPQTMKTTEQHGGMGPGTGGVCVRINHTTMISISKFQDYKHCKICMLLYQNSLVGEVKTSKGMSFNTIPNHN